MKILAFLCLDVMTPFHFECVSPKILVGIATMETNSRHLLVVCGPGSLVGIATGYGLEGPGIESRWGRDFPSVQTGPGAHPFSCTMSTGSFPDVKSGRGVRLTTHPFLVPWS